jgi:2-methylcitrate dehydratase PrpD
LSEPHVVRLARRVKVTAEPRFEEKFPQQCAARVSLTTSSGEVREAVCEEARGTLSHPLSDEDLKSKFVDLTSSLLDPQVAAQLADRVLDSGDESNVAEMMSVLG